MSEYTTLEVEVVPDILYGGIHASCHNELLNLCVTQSIPLFKHSNPNRSVWFAKYGGSWIWAYVH